MGSTRPQTQLPRNRIRETEANVVGIIRESDRALSDEAVALEAHNTTAWGSDMRWRRRRSTTALMMTGAAP